MNIIDKPKYFIDIIPFRLGNHKGTKRRNGNLRYAATSDKARRASA